MEQQIKELRLRAGDAIKNSATLKELDEVRVKFLGKKGELTGLLRGMNKLSAEERPLVGKIVNEARSELETLIAEKNSELKASELQAKLASEKIDVTLPGRRVHEGHLHPLTLTLNRVKEIFGAEHVNVQPHSGAQANMAVYFTILEQGDTVLGMNLSHGGHLTHGSPVNFSGVQYNFVEYGVDAESHRINYDDVLAKAKEHKPKLIVAGASAYPRVIDFKRFREIADEVGAYLMVDMAHIAGLVAAGLHPNPVPHAHFVTTTTHKTLRGPRGGMILCEEQFAKQIDKSIFPGIQGGPLMHVIAAKAVAFGEALQDDFKTYAQNIINNANRLAEGLQKEGLTLVSGGTDNHLILIDVRNLEITGKVAEHVLDEVGITVNKNTIPFETASPFVTSGVRIGTAAVTSRGFGLEEMDEIASLIAYTLKNHENEAALEEARKRVEALTSKFPMYPNL